MLKYLVTAIVAAILPTGAAQAQGEAFFAREGSWNIFKKDGNCVAFYDSGGESVSVFWPRARDAMVVMVHAIGGPAPMMLSGGVKVRMGDADWGQTIATPRPANKNGLNGVQFIRRDPRALDDFGRAQSLTFIAANQVSASVGLYGTQEVAAHLRRCVG